MMGNLGAQSRPVSKQRSSHETGVSLRWWLNKLQIVSLFVCRNKISSDNSFENTIRHGSLFLQFTSIEETCFPSNEQFIDNRSHLVPKCTLRYVNSFAWALWIFLSHDIKVYIAQFSI